MFESIDPMGIFMSIMSIFQIIVMLMLIGAGCYYFLFVSKFKHKFRVKEVINGRKIISDDKAREYKDEDGVVFWQLYKRKDKISVPPAEAIETDKKGRKCVEAYRTESGEYIYAIDTAVVKDVPKDILNIKDAGKREEKLEEWREKNNVISAFQPYTTKQRIILISEHKKALLKKTKKWQDYIIPVVGIAAVTILVVSLLIFYGDMAKPLLEMGDKLNHHAEIQKDQLEIIRDIKNDVQTLKNQNKPKAQEPPN